MRSLSVLGTTARLIFGLSGRGDGVYRAGEYRRNVRNTSLHQAKSREEADPKPKKRNRGALYSKNMLSCPRHRLTSVGDYQIALWRIPSCDILGKPPVTIEWPITPNQQRAVRASERPHQSPPALLLIPPPVPAGHSLVISR
jgi:hypothetical protein